MENVKDIIHSASNATFATLYTVQVIPFLVENCWLLILPIIIVSVDCWFGISESRLRKEKIRFSGAGWKTLRKLLDYYTLLILGFVIGHIIPESFNITVSESCFYSVLIPSIFDMCSIMGHIFKLHGITINPKKFILNMFVGLVRTQNSDIGNILEDSIKEIEENSNNNKIDNDGISE